MALSDRIRPDVEAAPWVIKEVKKLEAENARYREALEFYASSDNWTIPDNGNPLQDYITIIDDKEHGFDSMVGGRRAREALKGE